MPADNQLTNIPTENQQTELNQVVQRFRQLCDNLKSECGIARFGLEFGCGDARMRKRIGFWLFSRTSLNDRRYIVGPWLQNQMELAGIPKEERAVVEPIDRPSVTDGNIANSYVHYHGEQHLSQTELRELEHRFDSWRAFFTRLCPR